MDVRVLNRSPYTGHLSSGCSAVQHPETMRVGWQCWVAQVNKGHSGSVSSPSSPSSTSSASCTSSAGTAGGGRPRSRASPLPKPSSTSDAASCHSCSG